MTGGEAIGFIALLGVVVEAFYLKEALLHKSREGFIL